MNEEKVVIDDKWQLGLGGSIGDRNGSIQEVFKIKYKRFSDRLNIGEVMIKEGSVRNDSSVCASR